MVEELTPNLDQQSDFVKNKSLVLASILIGASILTIGVALAQIIRSSNTNTTQIPTPTPSVTNSPPSLKPTLLPSLTASPTLTTIQQRKNCKSEVDCGGFKCINGYCAGVDEEPYKKQKGCRDENDCAGSPCVSGYCQGIGEGADCVDGFVKVCQAGVCDCLKQ